MPPGPLPGSHWCALLGLVLAHPPTASLDHSASAFCFSACAPVTRAWPLPSSWFLSGIEVGADPRGTPVPLEVCPCCDVAPAFASLSPNQQALELPVPSVPVVWALVSVRRRVDGVGRGCDLLQPIRCLPPWMLLSWLMLRRRDPFVVWTGWGGAVTYCNRSGACRRGC